MMMTWDSDEAFCIIASDFGEVVIMYNNPQPRDDNDVGNAVPIADSSIKKDWGTLDELVAVNDHQQPHNDDDLGNAVPI